MLTLHIITSCSLKKGVGPFPKETNRWKRCGVKKVSDDLREVLRGSHLRASELEKYIEKVLAYMQQMRPSRVDSGSRAWEACMMPLLQERLDVKKFLKVMLLLHTLIREALHHLLRSRSLAVVHNVTSGRNHETRDVVWYHIRSARGRPWTQSPACPVWSDPEAHLWSWDLKKCAIIEHWSFFDYLECLLWNQRLIFLVASCPFSNLAWTHSPRVASHICVATNTRLDFPK